MRRVDDAGAPERLRALPSWLVARVALLGARTVTAHLEEAGMRRAHYALLVALREDGPASQAALGRRLAADRSDMHRTVGDLEARGLIAREPDPADRRRNVVTLTAPGAEALRDVDARVDAAQAELLEPLEPAERDEFVRLLTRVLARG
jgi:MarR family transcriptional regulator, lower aerobic nicotinate degradation pathway regulator